MPPRLACLPLARSVPHPTAVTLFVSGSFRQPLEGDSVMPVHQCALHFPFVIIRGATTDGFVPCLLGGDFRWSLIGHSCECFAKGQTLHGAVSLVSQPLFTLKVPPAAPLLPKGGPCLTFWEIAMHNNRVRDCRKLSQTGLGLSKNQVENQQ